MNAAAASSRRSRYLGSSSARSSADLSKAERTRLAQELRRDIYPKVRADWQYTRHPAANGSDTNGTVAIASGAVGIGSTEPEETPVVETPHDRESLNLPHRPRSFSSNSTSSNSSRSRSPRSPRSNGEENPYKFDSPDSVFPSISARRARKNRIKREELEEEMSWNGGLAHWTARRDAWSGGHVETTPSHISSPSTNASRGRGHSASSSTLNAEDATHITKTEVVPVYNPLFPPTHPLRRTVAPKNYKEIYDKIVVQSLTPAIPVNLADMTRLIVMGWQDNGEWPPKSTIAPEQPIARRRNGTAPTLIAQDAQAPKSDETERDQGRGRKGSVRGKVKKVLGFASHSTYGAPEADEGGL
ncbi:MAG: hypothetical protein M4579_001937 [Chaenotheca gracillima]|nr:MAG: hypothetical protein M4579_001937 [Chaenotheca gracillima]